MFVLEEATAPSSDPEEAVAPSSVPEEAAALSNVPEEAAAPSSDPEEAVALSSVPEEAAAPGSVPEGRGGRAATDTLLLQCYTRTLTTTHMTLTNRKSDLELGLNVGNVSSAQPLHRPAPTLLFPPLCSLLPAQAPPPPYSLPQCSLLPAPGSPHLTLAFPPPYPEALPTTYVSLTIPV